MRSLINHEGHETRRDKQAFPKFFFVFFVNFVVDPSYSEAPRVGMIEIMPLKAQPNRLLYVETLRRMTPAQRLAKAMELSDLGKRLFLHGLRKRFPDADEKEIHAIYLKHIARCHNRNY